MELTRLVHDKIVGEEYFDSRLIDKEKSIESLKKRKMVYKCTYELFTGHVPPKSYESNPTRREYTENGGKLNGKRY